MSLVKKKKSNLPASCSANAGLDTGGACETAGLVKQQTGEQY